jgi:hypothetical protein
MAKSVHSKRRKRNQSIKRKVLYEKVFRPRLEETSLRLLKRTFANGDDSVVMRKKNAYRYPNDPTAIFPQAEAPIYIERRSKNLPREFLIKEKGTKVKNLKKKAHIESLSHAIQEAEDRVEGKFRENDIIEIDKIDDDIDQQMNRMEMDEGKKNKPRNKRQFKKSDGMDVEKGGVKRKNKTNFRTHRNRKNKSYHLMNN